jgi:biopolymer transport protein ExbB
MTVLEILSKGGWIVIPIYILSIVALYIFIERLLVLRKLRINTNTFVLQIRNLLLRNQTEEAIMLCKKTAGPIAKMTRAGIENASRPRMEIKDAIESAGKTEIFVLEKNLGTLSTVASVAPMLGFLGTVTGMIRAFMEIQSRGGNVDASVLAGGIWEALVTTAVGLAVGIVSIMFYNHIQGKVEKIVSEMQNVSTELLDAILNETGAARHEFANK